MKNISKPISWVRKKRKKVLNKELVLFPYPHIFINDFNSHEYADYLIDNIPDLNQFVSKEDAGTTYIFPNNWNNPWNEYGELIYNLMIELIPKFEPYITQKQKALKQAGYKYSYLAKQADYLGLTNPNRGCPPHEDSDEWALIAVSVFGYLNGDMAPVTTLYEKSTMKATTYPHSRTSLLIFFNDNSLHGVAEPVRQNRLIHTTQLSYF